MKQHVVQSELMLAPEVDARVPYSRAHFIAEDQGEFPKHKRIGASRVAWSVQKLSDGSQSAWRTSHE